MARRRIIRKVVNLLKKKEATTTTQIIKPATASVYVTDYDNGGSKIIKTETTPATGQTKVITIRKSSPTSTPQITEQIYKTPQQVPTFYITSESAPLVNRTALRNFQNRLRQARTERQQKLSNNLRINISKKLGQTYKRFDIISGGKLTQLKISKKQKGLNEEIEKFNKKYEGVKELEQKDYSEYEREYNYISRKQEQIESESKGLKASGRGKWGDILKTISGKNLYERTPEQAKKEMENANKTLSKIQNKIERLEGKTGIVNKSRTNILRKLLTAELNNIRDIENLENRKINAGYVIISPAPLGVTTGFKGFKQGLRDLYGIRLKGSKNLTKDINQYYLKPSKAQLKKIQLRQKQLKAYDKQIIKQINRVKVVKKVDRKKIKYVGKIGNTRFYELKKVPKVIKVIDKKKLPVKTKYLGEFNKVKFYKIIRQKKIVKLANSQLPSYKYIGKYEGVKFYQKLKPIKGKANNYGIIGNKREIAFRYSKVGKIGNTNIYKLKPKIKTPKIKTRTFKREVIKEIRQPNYKLKQVYINEKGQILKGNEIIIKIDISKADVKNLIVRTIRNMPDKKRQVFLNNLRKINKNISNQVKQANFIKNLNKVNVPISTFRNIISELSVLSQLYKQKLISKEKLDNSQRKILNIRSSRKQGEGGKVTSRQIQPQILTSSQIQAQRQAEQIILKQIERLGGVTQINKQKLIYYLRLNFKKPSTQKPKNLKTGWVVYGLNKGAYARLNKKPLSKQDALSRGAYAIDRTTSRTFKIIPLPNVKTFGRLIKREKGYYTRTKSKFREFRIKEGTKYFLKYKYIEKTKHAIDTLGEKKGLSLQRYLSKLKKQGKY